MQDLLLRKQQACLAQTATLVAEAADTTREIERKPQVGDLQLEPVQARRPGAAAGQTAAELRDRRQVDRLKGNPSLPESSGPRGRTTFRPYHLRGLGYTSLRAGARSRWLV